MKLRERREKEFALLIVCEYIYLISFDILYISSRNNISSILGVVPPLSPTYACPHGPKCSRVSFVSSTSVIVKSDAACCILKLMNLDFVDTLIDIIEVNVFFNFPISGEKGS